MSKRRKYKNFIKKHNKEYFYLLIFRTHTQKCRRLIFFPFLSILLKEISNFPQFSVYFILTFRYCLEVLIPRIVSAFYIFFNSTISFNPAIIFLNLNLFPVFTHCFVFFYQNNSRLKKYPFVEGSSYSS